jgi:chaperonin cofactor prefoldin
MPTPNIDRQADMLEGFADKLQGRSDKLEARADKLRGLADALRESGMQRFADKLDARADKLDARSDRLEAAAEHWDDRADQLRDKGASDRAQAAIQKHEGTGVNRAPYNNDNRLGIHELNHAGIEAGSKVSKLLRSELGDKDGFLNAQELVQAQKLGVISISEDGSKIELTAKGRMLNEGKLELQDLVVADRLRNQGGPRDAMANALERSADKHDKKADRLEDRADKLHDLADDLRDAGKFKLAARVERQADRLDDRADVLEKKADRLDAMADRLRGDWNEPQTRPLERPMVLNQVIEKKLESLIDRMPLSAAIPTMHIGAPALMQTMGGLGMPGMGPMGNPFEVKDEEVEDDERR